MASDKKDYRNMALDTDKYKDYLRKRTALSSFYGRMEQYQKDLQRRDENERQEYERQRQDAIRESMKHEQDDVRAEKQYRRWMDQKDQYDKAVAKQTARDVRGDDVRQEKQYNRWMDQLAEQKKQLEKSRQFAVSGDDVRQEKQYKRYMDALENQRKLQEKSRKYAVSGDDVRDEKSFTRYMNSLAEKQKQQEQSKKEWQQYMTGVGKDEKALMRAESRYRSATESAAKLAKEQPEKAAELKRKSDLDEWLEILNQMNQAKKNTNNVFKGDMDYSTWMGQPSEEVRKALQIRNARRATQQWWDDREAGKLGQDGDIAGMNQAQRDEYRKELEKKKAGYQQEIEQITRDTYAGKDLLSTDEQVQQYMDILEGDYSDEEKIAAQEALEQLYSEGETARTDGWESQEKRKRTAEDMLSYTDDLLAQLDYQDRLENRYNELMSGEITGDTSWDPAYSVQREEINDAWDTMSVGRNVDDVYNALNPEAKNWTTDITDTGLGPVYLMNDEMRDRFISLYKEGKKDEAWAFFEGVRPYLNQAYRYFEKTKQEEEASRNPIISTIGTEAAHILQPAEFIANLPAQIKALITGEQSGTTDPYSSNYALARYKNTVRNKIAENIGENGWIYSGLMSGVDSALNVALAKGIGLKGDALEHGTLALFFTQGFDTSLQNAMENGTGNFAYDFMEAFIDSAIETATEVYSVEKWLQNPTNLLQYILKIPLSEASEEVVGAVLEPYIKELTGHRNQYKEREKQILASGGYWSGDNWVKVDNADDAKRQALHEWNHDIIMAAAQALMSVGPATVYGGAQIASQNRNVGRQIQNQQNGTETTGLDTVLEAAKGMEPGTRSYQEAEKISKRLEQNKAPGNYRVGQLASDMMRESKELAEEKSKGALHDEVFRELSGKEIKGSNTEEMTDLIMKAIDAGGIDNLSKKERVKIHDSSIAYNTYLKYVYASEQSTRAMEAQEKATQAEQKAMKSVSDALSNRKVQTQAEDTDFVGRQLATQEDIDRAEGKRTKRPDEIIVDRKYARLDGMELVDEGDGKQKWMYKVQTENGTEYKDASEIKATNFSTAAVVRQQQLNPEVYSGDYTNELLKQINTQPNTKIGRYMMEAEQVRWAAFAGLDMPATSAMSEKQAQEIYRISQMDKQKEWAADQASRVSNFKGRGKGQAFFDGAEFGTEEWTKKLDGMDLSQEERQLVEGLAAFAQDSGIRFDFVDQINGNDYIHGSENQGGIRIALQSYDSAKAKQQGRTHNLAVTVGHELTHWMRRNNAAGYIELQDYVMRSMTGRGINVAARAMEMMENRRRNGDNLTMSGAIEEIVANACDQALTSEEGVQRLEQENPKLAEKIRGFIKDLVQRIKAAIGMGENLSSASRDAMMMVGEEANRLHKLWWGKFDETLSGQVKELQAPEEEKEAASMAEEDAKFSMAETTLDDMFDNPKAYNDYFKYDNLIKKGPIKVVKLNTNNKLTDREDYINAGIENAKKYGFEKNGNVYIHVDDTNSDVMVTKKSMDHTPVRYTGDQRPIFENIGEMLKNSIIYNTADGRNTNQKGMYMLLGAGALSDGTIVYASFNVNRYTHKLDEIDVLYSIKHQKEAAVSMTAPMANGRYATAPSVISVAEAFEAVKDNFANTLPQDVLDHFGVQRRVTKDTGYLHYSMAEMDSEYDKAVKSGDVEEQQELVYAAGAKNGYTIKAYHGTGRADRVGTVFRPERATSGPMAYFTDNREIASNYARDKKDTSIAYDEDYDDYHTQFRVTIKGKDVPVSKLWNTLSFSDRQKITEKAKHITLDDEAENIIYDPDAQYGVGNFNDYERKLHGWNSIETLIDGWLDGGTLFDREADFLQVLKLAGIEGVTYKDPNYREEKVYDTLLKIQHPFDVAKEYTGKFLEDLKEWWNNQDQEQYQKESAGADFWDKNGITVDEWIDYGFEDVERGSSNNWTRIPDGVTAYLKEKGYDGIKDNGGKGGGMGHTVWIPFSGEQVKSADPVTYDDAGKVIPLSERFNEKDNDIRWSMAEMEKEYDQAAKNAMDYLKKNGKLPAGSRMDSFVKEAAQRKGYTDKAYHGTMMFGFTKFDTKAGQGTIFVAYDEPVARTYTESTGKRREIYTRNGVPLNHYVMSDKDLMDYYVSLHDNKFTNILSIERMDDNGTQSPVDKFEYVYQDNIFNEINTSVLRRFEMWQHIENATNANGELNGIYELYTKPGKQLVVDADGKNWNEIPFDTRNAELTIDENDQYYYEPEDLERFEELGLDTPSVNTRELAQWAQDHGYDSVRINNVWDDGGRNRDVAWEDRNGDIGIFFNPADVKSADRIVLDDQGKVIPLSERFNDKNTDIRWSMAEEVDDGAMFAMTDENAADIGVWMMSLTQSSVHTEGERALIQEYRGLKTTIDLTRKKLIDYRNELKRLQKKGGMLTADERKTMTELEARIQTNEDKMARLEQELYEVTRGEGYAAMMYRNSQIYKDHIEGKSQIQVEAAVDQLMSEVEDANKEIGARQKVLNRMSEESAVKTVRRELRNRGLKQNAAALKDGYFTTMSNAELEARLAEIVVKAVNGEEAESIKTAIDSLAADIVNSPVSRMAEDAQDALRPLKGRTVTFGPSEQAELKAIGYTLAEIRSMTKGSGITFKFGENSTLQGDLEEIAKEAPAIRDELMDKSTSAEQAAVVLVDWVAGKMKDMKGNPKDFNFDTKEVSFVVLACMQQMLNENQGGMTRAALRKKIDTAAGEIGKMADAVNSLMETVQKIRQNAIKASNAAGGLRGDMAAAVDYYNLIARQAAEVERARVKRDVIEKLRSENTKKLIEQQQKYQEMMKKDRRARELQHDNEQLRKVITTDAKRLKDRLVAETDQKNIPEEAKPLARMLVSMLVNHDMAGWRRVLNADKKMLADVQMRLAKMDEVNGTFDMDADLDWLVIKTPNPEDYDYSIRDSVLVDLMNIEQGLVEYRTAEGRGNVSLQDRKNALDKIQKAVSEIYDVIKARETAFIQGQKWQVYELAEQMEKDMENSRFKGERRGPKSKVKDWFWNDVGYGNLTPEYFFKNIKNRTMSILHGGLHEAEQQSGLQALAAKRRLEQIAKDTGYATWDGQQKHKVKLENGRVIEMSTEQIMSLYATWNREKNQLRPEATAHLLHGGFVLAEGDTTQGKERREKSSRRPIRMNENDLNSLGGYLTEQQKAWVDKIVEYMSTDMAKIGNEASMKAYGIKKFTEQYYFPIKSWEGVQNRSSASGITNNSDNRAMRQSFSKRVMNNARNAIEIGDFTATTMKHITGMITFNTVGPAVENLNKVLNQQLDYNDSENMDPDESYKRNMRAAFAENYGQMALKYLEQFMKDVNGGVARRNETIMREKLLTMFKKNAVAGSLSVTAQQPLSYIRAAMLINPKYLAAAINPQYWKGSYQEMLEHSGIAVIKEMGRFDMNFGQSMTDFITPEGLKGTKEKIRDVSDKATSLPGYADRMTWTRMWSAVKLEQATLHPEMNTKSEEFLDMVAERFNELMRRTQVYDSVMVKSQNMRSDNYLNKIRTSFMAEPTLSLNVLADAWMNMKEKGGKANAAKALATFMLSAALQAGAKAFFGTGRSPDKKKTAEENFLNKFLQNLLSEANPFGLIPGYSQMVEAFINGELNDDAMGMIGKAKEAWNKMKDVAVEMAGAVISGKKVSVKYRDIEDSAGQIVQMFTSVPLKNFMRDFRAMANWVSGGTSEWTGNAFAQRETSAAVLQVQSIENLMNKELGGLLNAMMGSAGYDTKATSYVQRIYEAEKKGNQQKADMFREFLVKAKLNGENPGKWIDTELNKLTKDDGSLSTEEKIEALGEGGYKKMSEYINDQYRAGEIDRKTAEEQYKKANPNASDKDVAKFLDKTDWEKAGKPLAAGQDNYTNYTPLFVAMQNNKADEIRDAVDRMKEIGYTEKDIKKYVGEKNGVICNQYMEADADGRRRIRDAMQKAYKDLGFTAEDADKTINGWTKEKKK